MARARRRFAVLVGREQIHIGIYGALKLAGEKMVIAYQQVFDLAYTIVRPSADTAALAGAPRRESALTGWGR